MKDKATKPPFLTGFMIAVKNQTVNHTPIPRLQVFRSLPFIYKEIWIIHIYALIGRRHFWRKVPAGLLWLLQTFRAGGSGFSDNQCPSDWNLPFSTRV